jgi:integrase
VPTLGHLPVRMITNGAVDRAVHGWIADECSRSTVKDSLAALVRVMEQALRDGIIDRNPARITGWQRECRRAEDELDDPRSLALPDWSALSQLADALVPRSTDQYPGWGQVVIFAACTAARIGEVAGVRAGDVDTSSWTWTVRRQTTPAPGGVIDKGTKGKRARAVPIITEVRELVADRVTAAGTDPHRPAAHRSPWRPDHHRGVTRCGPLGRGGDGARLRAPASPRLEAHRSDMDGGCRGPCARPTEDRRSRVAHHHSATCTPTPPRLPPRATR